jgi:hypothetical protein
MNVIPNRLIQRGFILAAWIGLVLVLIAAVALNAQSSKLSDRVWVYIPAGYHYSTSLDTWSTASAFEVMWGSIALYFIAVVVISALWLALRRKSIPNAPLLVGLLLPTMLSWFAMTDAVTNLLPQLNLEIVSRAAAKAALSDSSVTYGVSSAVLAILVIGAGFLISKYLPHTSAELEDTGLVVGDF